MTETGLKNLIDELPMKDVKNVDVLKILDIPSYLKIFNLNFPSSKKAYWINSVKKRSFKNPKTVVTMSQILVPFFLPRI
ncbi:MAG TPA: hypothetical protein VK469_10875 [Candidatus Kapabacteria bacterium]|nr:hypothetical protein [Candidatus Kapabacteria bacterium]